MHRNDLPVKTDLEPSPQPRKLLWASVGLIAAGLASLGSWVTPSHARQPLAAMSPAELAATCEFLASPKADDMTLVLPPEVYAACGLAAPPPAVGPRIAPLPTPPEVGAPAAPVPFFGPDVRVNDPTPDLHPNFGETQNETTVAVEGDTVCVAYNDFAGNMGISRSMMRGAPGTFTDGQVAPSDGDPVLAVHADGDFALAHMRDINGKNASDEILVSSADDDCETFQFDDVAQEPTCIGGANAGAPCLEGSECPGGRCAIDNVDKPWVAVDRTGGANNGNVYVCWTEFNDFGPCILNCVGGANAGVACAADSECPGGVCVGACTDAPNPPCTKDSDCESVSQIRFRPGIPFNVNPIVDLSTGAFNNLVQGCQVAVGKDGEVFAAWEEGARHTEPGSIWFARSVNAGAAFPLILKVSDLIRHAGNPVTCQGGANNGNPCYGRNSECPGGACVGNCPARPFFGGALGPAGREIRIQDFPALAANPTNDDVYLVWNERIAPTDPDIVFFRSVNDGANWTFMGIVHDVVTNDQFEPAVTVAPRGQIKVQWYDRRNDPDNVNIDLFAAISTNRGVSFDENRVTDVSFGVDQFVPVPSNCYMGEYNGLTADDRNFFHVWGDNRDISTGAAHGLNCVGGANNTQFCRNDSECPGGVCGHLDPNVYFDKQVVPSRHFDCYETAREPFPTIPGVTLDDQFGPSTADLITLKRLCAPANKNGEDPDALFDPEHLAGYVLKQTTPPFEHITGVEVVDQFGTIVVDLVKPDLLLVPTAKSLLGPPSPLVDPAIDHFKCYRVRKAQRRVQGVNVIDQIAALVVDVKKAYRLCTPVMKNGEPVNNPEAHLMCYRVRDRSEPRFRGLESIFIDNQFGQTTIAVDHIRELCVPAVKNLL